MTNSQTPDQWLNTYLDTIPPAIRPSSEDRLFLNAAQAAHRNGWRGDHIAGLVAAYDYATAHNPTLIAIRHLARLAERPPISHTTSNGGEPWRTNLPTHCTHPQNTHELKPNQCRACRAQAGEPQTSPPRKDEPGPNHISGAWLKERRELLAELSRTPDLSEDEREDAMTTLIRDQHQR